MLVACGILDLESGIPKDYNITKIRDLVLGIRYPRGRIQNPKLSCIPLHGWLGGGGEGGGGRKGYISLSLSFQATRFYSHSVLLLA